jgi:L-fuculose-phosphate aldolase
MSARQAKGQKVSTIDATRADLVACGRTLLARGLLSQTSGNLSTRVSSDEICITPSGMEYDLLEPADIATVDLAGNLRAGRRAPSSETPLHCLVYASRADISAIVHTHSPYATTLAILGLPIPAVHYMIARARTTQIEVASYATYGTDTLARNVRDAFAAPALAVLLANHGLVAAGSTLAEAAEIAEGVEMLARLYYQALAVGTPHVLSAGQMAEVMDKYEQRRQAARPTARSESASSDV